MRRPARTRRRARRGAVALEFALIAIGFLGLVLFTFFLAFRMYVQVALEYAASRAARLLAVDSTQALSQKPGTFQAVSFCQLLQPFLSCTNLVITLQPVTSYLGSTSTTVPVTAGVIQTSGLTFNAGQGSSLMLLQATYLVPIPGWPWASSQLLGMNGSTGLGVTVNYPYQNEY